MIEKQTNKQIWENRSQLLNYVVEKTGRQTVLFVLYGLTFYTEREGQSVFDSRETSFSSIDKPIPNCVASDDTHPPHKVDLKLKN